MRISLLPPLMVLCSDLLFQKPSSLAFPLVQPNTQLEQPARDTSTGRSYNLIFHPPTKSCVLRKSMDDPLKLGPCAQSDAWAYTPQKFLTVKGTYFCLQAVDSGKPAKLGIICQESDSKWETTSNTKTNLLSNLPDGRSLCLDVDSDNTLITNPCMPLSSSGVSESDSQWFEIVSSKGKQYYVGNAFLATKSIPDAP